MNQGKVAVLIVAAGRGTRSGDTLPKQYRLLAGRPVLAHAIDHLRHPWIDTIRVVIGEGQEALYHDAGGALLPSPPITGGAERQISVRNGLEAIAAEGGAEVVLIHDAARPFVPGAIIERLINALGSADGAVPALPVADTLARGGDQLGDTVSREGLVRVQTPQAFRFDAILAAHRAWPEAGTASDDAQIARAAGLEILTVKGDAALEKLTWPEDFVRADAWLERASVPKTGMGFDVHRFRDGDHIWLGGIRIESDRGLEGHSDADVVLHAICDALLGTIAEGDIGIHFPPSDPKWKGAPSSLFVEHVRDLVEGAGGRIDHVDVTIICEAPRVGPYRGTMRSRIAELLRIPERAVSIKATTTEGLGFTGRREGIAAQAVASVRIKGDRMTDFDGGADLPPDNRPLQPGAIRHEGPNAVSSRSTGGQDHASDGHG